MQEVLLSKRVLVLARDFFCEQVQQRARVVVAAPDTAGGAGAVMAAERVGPDGQVGLTD